jgi:hypothetical protein
MPAMRHLSYEMRLTGRLTLVSAGVLRRTETELPDGARLESELLFADESTFREHGTVTFGPGSHLHFQTLGMGQLTPSVDPNVRLGTVTWELDGGRGRFAHASGRITSNFMVRAQGEVEDAHIGFVFLCDRAEEEEQAQ